MKCGDAKTATTFVKHYVAHIDKSQNDIVKKLVDLQSAYGMMHQELKEQLSRQAQAVGTKLKSPRSSRDRKSPRHRDERPSSRVAFGMKGSTSVHGQEIRQEPSLTFSEYSSNTASRITPAPSLKSGLSRLDVAGLLASIKTKRQPSDAMDEEVVDIDEACERGHWNVFGSEDQTTTARVEGAEDSDVCVNV